jgi:hypothetical protein
MMRRLCCVLLTGDISMSKLTVLLGFIILAIIVIAAVIYFMRRRRSL